MVVVLIIGILMAIAVPTFMGARKAAAARAVEANLRDALTAEQTYFSDAGGQLYGKASEIQPLETSLQLSDAGSTTGGSGTTAPVSGSNNVSVYGTSAADATTVELGGRGSDNRCYYVYDNQGAVSYYIDASCGTPPVGGPAVGTNSLGAWSSTW